MKTKIIFWIIGIIIVSLFLFGSSPEETNSNQDLILGESTINSNVIKEEIPKEIIEIAISEPTSNLYTVTKVVDGDTIELSSGERVRLVCIDTPERGEDGYSEATDYLRGLILNKDVELVKDISETDRYGRLLRYIYLEDGTFVNERVVYYGYGKAYPYNPDTSLCPEIREAEQYAKDNDLGIWVETIEKETSSNSNVGCGSDTYNCGDFSTCSEVMEVFNACSYDVNQLDGDDDGIPCESLCG